MGQLAACVVDPVARSVEDSIHGKHGKGRENEEGEGKIMEGSCENHGKIIGKMTGKSGKSWENGGKIRKITGK